MEQTGGEGGAPVARRPVVGRSVLSHRPQLIARLAAIERWLRGREGVARLWLPALAVAMGAAAGPNEQQVRLGDGQLGAEAIVG
jgi:hypothetical protein